MTRDPPKFIIFLTMQSSAPTRVQPSCRSCMMHPPQANGNPSLNECLHVGPKFNQKLLDILIRFRAHRVVVIADIEKAFLMVSVEESDCHALRFLWVYNVEVNPPKIRPLRFTMGYFGGFFKPLPLKRDHQAPLGTLQRISPRPHSAPNRFLLC